MTPRNEFLKLMPNYVTGDEITKMHRRLEERPIEEPVRYWTMQTPAVHSDLIRISFGRKGDGAITPIVQAVDKYGNVDESGGWDNGRPCPPLC